MSELFKIVGRPVKKGIYPNEIMFKVPLDIAPTQKGFDAWYAKNPLAGNKSQMGMFFINGLEQWGEPFVSNFSFLLQNAENQGLKFEKNRVIFILKDGKVIGLRYYLWLDEDIPAPLGLNDNITSYYQQIGNKISLVKEVDSDGKEFVYTADHAATLSGPILTSLLFYAAVIALIALVNYAVIPVAKIIDRWIVRPLWKAGDKLDTVTKGGSTTLLVAAGILVGGFYVWRRSSVDSTPKSNKRKEIK
jgi:hypothetical protein